LYCVWRCSRRWPCQEREDDVGNFARLAVPDELDLAFAAEEQEAVLLGERLVGLQEADDVLLFLVGETRHLWLFERWQELD
jgi:hypothetical protein